MAHFLSHLECSKCSRKHDPNEPQTVCVECKGVLLARYDLDKVAKALSKNDLRSRVGSMWRYRELLPIKEEKNIVTLGEGFTPILQLKRLGPKLGFKHLFLKDDGQIPTGSFKARGMSAAISKCKELGIGKVAVPTAGNAGAAMSAYAAQAGIEAHVYMPRETPEVIKLECAVYGAQVTVVDGTIADAGKLVGEGTARKVWFEMSTMKEPYRVEGKKTMGFEIAEQFEWTLPDVILYPTGGGTGIVGMAKAFDELESIGWIKGARPRFVAVQTSGCAPIAKAIQDHKGNCDFWENAKTIAAGLRVPKPYADYLIIKAVNASKGTSTVVSEEELLKSVKLLARTEGNWICPEGGATIASLPHLLEEGVVDRDENVVLYNTGVGILYQETAREP
ncbi:MAG TPA: threonine synthase [Candidatus Bathyarchaeia archaeon]|nr:threonine synthase [Candidatus Bathyarchaeia archaeon]